MQHRQQANPRSKRRASIAAVAAAVLAVTLAPTTAAQAEPTAYDWNLGDDTARITLVTGDLVTIKATDGKTSPRVTPASGRESIPIHITNEDGHLYVIPADAGRLIAAGTLDRRLFDITTLLEQGYSDDDRDDLPLIVRTGNDLATTTNAQPLGGLGLVTADQSKSSTAQFWQEITGSQMGTLAAGVDEIWLDGKRTLSLDSSVPQIGAPEAWEAGYTGEGVTIAVLDTGIDVDHPDVADRIIEAQDFTGTDISDQVGHGTHVAATIAGTGDASDGKYKGVAPDAGLLIGKVCTDTECDESAILAGMAWAAESGATAVNVSLGGIDTPEIDPLEQAVADLTEQYGTLFVIAAGNGGNSVVDSPGSATDALTVGAVDRDETLADFSSRGPRIGDSALKPDITAPGVDIVAARATDTEMGTPMGDHYTVASGTSMATPHVAGAVALLAQQHPDWTGAEFKAALMGSAAPNPDLPVVGQGAGRVDAAAAVGQQLTAQPASVSIGLLEWSPGDPDPIDDTITYYNPTDEAVTLNLDVTGFGPDGAPIDGVFSLSTDSVDLAAGAKAEVVVTTALAADQPHGSYSASILATADRHTVQTPVLAVKEPESYDLAVTVLNRDGEPLTAGAFSLAMFSIDGSGSDIGVWVEGPETVVRVPVGEYHVEAVVFDELSDGTTLSTIVRPAMAHTEDATWAIDARDAKPVSVNIDNQDVDQQVGFFGYVREFDWGSYGSMTLSESFDELFIGVQGPSAPEGAITTEVNGYWTDPDGSTSYWVALAEPGITNGFTADLVQSDFATVDTRIRSQHPDKQGELTWWADGPDGGVGFGTTVDTPATITAHHNVDDYWTWTSDFAQVVRGDDGWPMYETREADAPFDHEAGETYEQVWNSAIFSPGFTLEGGGIWREGDSLELFLPAFSGPDLGRIGYSAIDSGRTALYQGDELIGEFDHIDYGVITGLPEEELEYRLVMEADRSTVSTVSTSVTYEWTFTSSAEEPNPALSAIRLAPQGFDDYNRAEAGVPVTIPVTVQSSSGQVVDRCDLSVDVSFDGGQTWEAVAVEDGQITVTAPAAGSVSLRATSTDDSGGSVSQTIIDAYLVA